MGFDEWWQLNARFGDDKVRLRQLWSAAIECAQRETVRYAEAQVAAERERCAAWVDARRDAFCEEHGSIDPDTGTLEFGRGTHAEAKSEYVGELEEIAAGLRALRA